MLLSQFLCNAWMESKKTNFKSFLQGSIKHLSGKNIETRLFGVQYLCLFNIWLPYLMCHCDFGEKIIRVLSVCVVLLCFALYFIHVLHILFCKANDHQVHLHACQMVAPCYGHYFAHMIIYVRICVFMEQFKVWVKGPHRCTVNSISIDFYFDLIHFNSIDCWIHIRMMCVSHYILFFSSFWLKEKRTNRCVRF